MILFKFPQKKIVLDCFTYLEQVIETAPIVPAMKIMPDWWKELPNSYLKPSGVETPTMKSCAGMVDYYKKSIVIPLWSEMYIHVRSDTDYNWVFSDGSSSASIHDVKQQAAGFLNNYAHIKMLNPWLLQTKESINWVWSHPVYAFPNSHNIVSLPAVTNFFDQASSHINIMIAAKEELKVTLPQGQPLAHITPMSDRKIEVVRHLITQQEFSRRNDCGVPITFLRKHDSIIKRKEQFSDCPFHNHLKGK